MMTAPTPEAAIGPQLLSGERRHSAAVSFPWPVVVLLLLIVAVYLRISVKLVVDWYELPDFSHGFLIPLFAGFLLWDRRKALAHVPTRSTWAGLPVVMLGLLLLLTGVFGADLFLSRVSFPILAAGIVWSLYGLQMLRQVRFVLLVLLLGIPLPAVVFNQITFPLQLLASRFAAVLLQASGVPVLRDGNVLSLSTMQLEVAQACSGIRSMLSLFTVAILFGYFFEATVRRRVILALSSLPVAVIANALRIYGTGLCVQYWDPDKAVGFFHEFSGWLIFVVSLVCLYLLHRIMAVVAPPRRGAAA